MRVESFRWLAAVIAAHPDRKVVGRTRLQKTIKLLKRKGLPSDLMFTIHFYGPYSEGMSSELYLLDRFGLVAEEERTGSDDRKYYTYTAQPEATLSEIKPFQGWIDAIRDAEDVPLELAATYDTFRSMDYDHAESLDFLRRKKGAKCHNGNEEKAFDLLRRLDLPAPAKSTLTDEPAIH